MTLLSDFQVEPLDYQSFQVHHESLRFHCEVVIANHGFPHPLFQGFEAHVLYHEQIHPFYLGLPDTNLNGYATVVDIFFQFQIVVPILQPTLILEDQ